MKLRMVLFTLFIPLFGLTITADLFQVAAAGEVVTEGTAVQDDPLNQTAVSTHP
jgi:hypothetical protein